MSRSTLAASRVAVLPLVAALWTVAPLPAQGPPQPVDVEYTAKIKEYLTDPRISTELVDHLPASSTVPITTLDDLVEAWGVRQIDLLKIDVDGYEPKVFAGAKRTLRERKIKAILCEFNGLWLKEGGSSSADLYRLLLDAGFRDSDVQAATPSEVHVENRLLILKDA